MSILPHVEHDPDSMTWSARTYLLLNLLCFGVVGWFCLFHSEQFAAAAYVPIVGLLDIRLWGGLFLGGGIVCLIAAITKSGDWARFGLAITAAVLGACAAGVWIGIIALWVEGKSATPLSTIFMSFVVVANILMCRRPLRTLFEQVVERAIRDE